MKSICTIIILMFFGTAVLAEDAPSLDSLGERISELYNAGDYEAAAAMARTALSRSRTELGPNASVSLSLQNQLAEALTPSRHTRAEALSLFEDAISRWEDNFNTTNPLFRFSPDGFTLNLTRNNYGNALRLVGRLEESQHALMEAVSTAEQVFGRENAVVNVFKLNLAITNRQLGYADEALEAYRDVYFFFLDAGEGLEHRAADAGAEAAGLLTELGRHEDALQVWDTVLRLSAQVYPPDHPTRVLRRVEALGALFDMRAMDRLDAEVLALAPLIEKTFGTNSKQMLDVRSFSALGNAVRSGGDPDVLEAAAQELMQVAEGFDALYGPGTQSAAEAYVNYGAMMLDAGNAAESHRALFEANESVYVHPNWLTKSTLAAARAGALSYEEAVAEIFEVVQGRSQSAFKTSARMLGSRLELRGGPGEAAYRRITDLAAEIDQRQAALVAASDQPLYLRSADAEAAQRDWIGAARAEIEQLESVVQNETPAAAAMLGDAIISMAEVQELLDPGEALVVIDIPSFDSPYNDVLFVSPDHIDWRAVDSDAESLRLAAGDLRSSINLRFGLRAGTLLRPATAEQETRDFNTRAAHYIYDTTFGQLGDALQGIDHLYVVLSGPLSSIPPQLLLKTLPEPGQTFSEMDWMVRDHAITVIPSPFALKVAELARASSRERQPMLAFGDPDFSAMGAPETMPVVAGALRAGLAPLPETEDEVREVGVALGASDADIFLGDAASERAAKDADLSGFEVLYFATHGLVAGDLVRGNEVAQPALALTAGEGEDGLLTASEISGLELDADLVVLSACNTALGAETGAEALSGLAQAFTYAGARSLMVSHWPVESQSAVQLMTDLFDARTADPTLTLAEAQRRSILTMLDGARNDWQHPAFWAPFVIVGASK